MSQSPPPSSPDPLSEELLERRLRAAAPAPLNAAFRERLRLACPVPTENVPQTAPSAIRTGTGTSTRTGPAATPAAVPIPFPPPRARRPFLSSWKPLAAAAALTLCGWAGWQATAPSPVPPGGSHTVGTETPAPGETDTALEFLPPLESRQHLLSVKDLGVVRDSHERPVRLMSTTWLDENSYGGSLKDPTLRESCLRHEIVPVLLPTY